MATTTKKTTTPKVDLSDVMVVDKEKKKIDLKKTTAGAIHIDDSALINVKSNVFGELIYVDPVTKEQVSWSRCGETLQLPLETLRHMKNGAVKFFTNQLVIITGFADENAEKYETADIYKALYISQYYQNIIDPTDYESICSMTPSEIRDTLSMMSSGAKAKLVVALNTYIEKGVLDSLKAIKTFEEVLGCELMRAD